MESSKILIVDDDQVILGFLRDALSAKGYDCTTAADGQEALDHLAGKAFDLVITDINMPRMDGSQLISQIKARDADKTVIVASAINDVGFMRRCIIQQGAYDYLVKPFSFDDVAQTVERAVEHIRLRKQVKDYQANLEQKVAVQAERIKRLYINGITSLVRALEAKDRHTQGHSQVVTRLSRKLALSLGLPQQSVEEINLSAQLHDIGKIGTLESILNKPDKLSPWEYEHIKQHTLLGEAILKPVIEDPKVLKNIRHHHERFDGEGYPDHLKGNEISLGAKIIALTDALESMTSDRPYRRAMSFAEAKYEIDRGWGSQFAPELAEVFIKTFPSEESLKQCRFQDTNTKDCV